MVAALAGWLAERDLALGDLRTGQSLEEAYLAITGARGEAMAAADPDGARHREAGPSSAGTGPDRRHGGPRR